MAFSIILHLFLESWSKRVFKNLLSLFFDWLEENQQEETQGLSLLVAFSIYPAGLYFS